MPVATPHAAAGISHYIIFSFFEFQNMATIKGQNLRVMFDSGDPETPNPCMAASTGCVLHLSAQVQEDTTKDTDDDWIVNEIVGLTWW